MVFSLIPEENMEHRTHTILVVDDEDFILKLICNMLLKEGFSVLPATDYQSGMQWLKREKVDLVITDLMLPDANGKYLLDFIRSNEALQHIPVIVVTGLSRNEPLPAQAVLEKPFDLRHLLNQVKRHLQTSEAADV